MTRLLVALGVLLVGLGADLSTAIAQGDAKAEIKTVRYSYEAWSRAGQKRYVLMPAPITIKPGTLQERTRALFRALVGAKPGSYGKAALAFKPDAMKTGIVYVYLDKEKAQYNPITMAETVYTFTENGASKVIFPKVQEQGWTRDDVPFPGYALTVPLWQALPPATLGGALVKLPDGTFMSSDAAVAALNKGDATLIEAAWGFVKSGPATASLAAVKAAPLLKLSDLEARLIPVLQSANKDLRSAAMDGLKGHDDKKVNTALRAVMDKDPEPDLRDKAAGLLSTSKDPNFSTAAQYHALRSKDPKVVSAAAKGLGQSPLPEAGKELITALGHPDAGVRTVVIASLLQRKDHALLVAALGNQELALAARIEGARALAAGTDKDAAHQALMFLAVSAKGDDSAGASAKLATFDKGPTYAALGKALMHSEPATRRAAASALARLGSPKGLPLLANANTKDADSGAALLSAIRTIYARQKLDFVLKGTKEKHPVLRQQAVATLGKMVGNKGGAKSRKTIVKALDPLAAASDPLIRAAAARSYGSMPGEDVQPALLKLAKDKAIEVQRSAAHALRAFPSKETTSVLLGYVGQKDPELLTNAIESLGLLKEKEALDRIVGHKDHKAVTVRRAVTGALVDIGGTLQGKERRPLMSLFSERLFDKDALVRLKAVRGLEIVQDPRTVTLLAALLKDPDKEVRQATLNAMAATGDAGAVETIATGLEDDDPDVRRTAIRALGNLEQKAGAKVLRDYAKEEKDKALAAEARKVAGAL